MFRLKVKRIKFIAWAPGLACYVLIREVKSPFFFSPQNSVRLVFVASPVNEVNLQRTQWAITPGSFATDLEKSGTGTPVPASDKPGTTGDPHRTCKGPRPGYLGTYLPRSCVAVRGRRVSSLVHTSSVEVEPSSGKAFTIFTDRIHTGSVH